MKRKHVLFVMCIMMVLVLALAGCGGKESAPPQQGGENGEQADDRANWPSRLSLGTAGTGGVYYVYGGWGNLVAEMLGVSVDIEQTGGPADNMMLVNDKANDMGMITMGIGWEGWNGLEGTAFEGNPCKNVRAMFPMYSTYSQFWAHKDTGIKSIWDLDGKSVGVGPTGGTPGTYHPLIFELLGINARPVFGAIGDLVESQQDGLVDANSFASGIPLAAVLNYAANVGPENVVFFGIDGEAREKVIEAYPYWTPDVIPADTYEFIDEDIETINVFNWAICHKDLPESLVYEIVDVIMTNNDRMMEIHVAAAETVPEKVNTNTFLPLHPGAYRWFVEHGYEVPEGAKPID